MSLIGLNTTPAERMRGCKFAENFFNTAKVAENGGTLTGSPPVNQGITLDGLTQYATYALSGAEFNSSQLSIVVEFYPDFDLDSGTSYYFYDGSSGERNLCYITAAGALGIFMGNTGFPAIPKANYENYWYVGQKNVLVVSGTSGNTNIWLNGAQIMSGNTTAWTPKSTSSLYVGVSFVITAPFDGRITKFQVYHSLLTEEEAIDLYQNDTYDYRDNMTLDLPCDSRFDNPTLKKAEDSTFNANDATLGDGVTASLMPTKLSGRRGYTFDGIDDYISGITAPTGSFTVSVMKRVSGVVSITQENDLTTWNQLFSSGGFTGELLTLRVHPSVLTETQKLDEQFLLNERLNVHGLPSGIISSLVSEGACVMYQDYRSGSFRDWSENGNDPGTLTGISWATRAINYTALGDKIVVPDAASIQFGEGALVVYGDFSSITNNARLLAKRDVGGTQFEWYISSPSGYMKIYDGSNFREITASTVLGKKYHAVNLGVGEAPEGFEDGLSIGPYDGVSTFSAEVGTDLWIGNSELFPTNSLRNCNLQAVLLFNRKLTETEHRRLYSELYADSWATEVLSRYVADVVEYVEPDDPTLRLALDVKSSAGVCNDLSGYGNHGTPATGVMNKVDSLGTASRSYGTTGIDCGSDGSLNVTSSFTLSCWVHLEELPSISVYFMRRDHYGLYITTGGTIYFLTRKLDDSGNDTYATSDNPLAAGRRYHIAAVYDATAGTKQVFVDGIAQTPVAKTDGGMPTSIGLNMYIGSNGISTDYTGDTLLPQVFAEAKSAAWIQAEYAKGLGALSQTNGAAQESIANETSGYLSNTPFEILSGTWKVSEDTIDETPVKVLECVAGGALAIPAASLYQNQEEAAAGTFEFWTRKGVSSFARFSIGSQKTLSSATGFNGYDIVSQIGSTFGFVRRTNGGSFTLMYGPSGYIPTATWVKFKVTISTSRVFTCYMNDVLIDLTGGLPGKTDNPITDTTYTTAGYVIIELGTGDKIAFSDKSGNYAITKKLLAEE